jgi:hypothetical protein
MSKDIEGFQVERLKNIEDLLKDSKKTTKTKKE